MSQLSKFFFSASGGERVIGTYLYPYVLFIEHIEQIHSDPYFATEVFERTIIGENEILFTRNGGLFVRPPLSLSDPYRDQSAVTLTNDFKAKLSFQEKAATCFNRIICEFAFLGIVSEAATPVHISYGQLINAHALITSGGGGREMYLERTSYPSKLLLKDDWRTHRMFPTAQATKVMKQDCTRTLVKISEELPALIVGAYSLFSQRQLSESLIDSWIVCEQAINHLWKNYLSTIKDTSRIKRLNDSRTYSASVRTEILHSIGKIPTPIYEELNKARKNRNDLAHGAKTTLSAATICLNTMKLIIEFLCQKTVEPPQTSVGVNW